jgi:hypothetical protein
MPWTPAIPHRALCSFALAGCMLFPAALGAGRQDAGPAPAAAGASAPAPAAPAAPAPVVLTDADMEQFLRKAKIVRQRGAGKGVTGSIRATMSDGTITHDAHIQTVNEHKREFRGGNTVEFDFKDSWTFNVAAYKLDRLIGLNMVPVSVPGRLRSDRAAVTWWVDDVMMDEGGRIKQKAEPPAEKAQYWREQLSLMRIFDQLIYNTDRNLGNMLIGSDWRLWLIDHTRAFRNHSTLRSPTHVVMCDRAVLERLKALNTDVLKRELSEYLDNAQLKGILDRRDLIVARVESLGPAALFDREAGAAP